MRRLGVIGCLLAGGLLAAPPLFAADPSVTCSTEYTRRMAIAASDYAEPNPAWAYWVDVAGQRQGPWTIIDIKREMLLGRLPTGLYFHPANGKGGWQWSASAPEFDPLPPDPAVTDAEIAQGLKALLEGCWVSDPVAEAAGQETVWLFLLFDTGPFFPSRGVRDRATGEEGFWFTRSSNLHWGIAGQQGRNFRLVLPDIGYLDPVDEVPARIVDRNTLVIDLPGSGPGPGGVVFRRM